MIKKFPRKKMQAGIRQGEKQSIKQSANKHGLLAGIDWATCHLSQAFITMVHNECVPMYTMNV